MGTVSVIDFTDEGQGECLYTEAVDLRGIGRLRCERASVLEFNEYSQEWEVKKPSGGKVLFSHSSRQICLDWEREHLGPAESPAVETVNQTERNMKWNRK